MTAGNVKSINHKELKHYYYLADLVWHFDVDDYGCDVDSDWDRLDYCCSSGYQH
jgi:hypothetical protein